MPEKKTIDRVYITVPQEMTRLKGEEYAIIRSDGSRETKTADWNTFQLPSRISVGDNRLSFGTVINKFANTNDDGTVTFPFIASRTVPVKVAKRDENGAPILDENGRHLYEVVEVDPAALKEAIDSYEYLVMHKAFVKRDIEYVDTEGEKRKFNSVTFAPGTKVGDYDLSNAQFSPFSVIRGYRTQEVEVIPMPKDRVVFVNIPVEEDGHLVHKKGTENCIKVMPKELVEAAREQRKAYVAAHKAQTAEPIVEDAPTPELYDHDVEFGPEEHTSPRR